MLQWRCLLLALASRTAVGAHKGGVPDFAGVKVITFDFYAALMNTTGSLRENGREILAQDPATDRWSPTQADAFVMAWEKQYSSYVGIVNALQRNAGLHWAEADLFKVMLHTTLNYTCASQKVALSASTREALAQAWKNLKPWPNTLAVLQTLRSTGRFKLALLSNGDAEFLHAAAAALPAMDAEFGGDGLGVGGVSLFKPEPELYHQVRSLLPDEPEDQWKNKVLHVAGAPYDASGSKAFGFHTAWNSMQADPAFLDYTGTGQNVPDVVLHDIGELPRTLGIEADIGELPSALELESELAVRILFA